eukprot:TRINITY_DN3860_c0_g1_i2.p1 TRINITY_DN3860_c0_g1~~TRINITY_DN3860_c0_g1_i2.p1  ORF type:complete len:501 (+),score=91.30 TRINITY_DN3860_c0_g1_i2:108-1610(+)
MVFSAKVGASDHSLDNNSVKSFLSPSIVGGSTVYPGRSVAEGRQIVISWWAQLRLPRLANSEDSTQDPECLQAILDRFLLHPQSSVRLFLDVLVLCLLIWSAVAVPYFTAFEDFDVSSFWFYLDLFIDTVFTIDLFLNFFTIAIDSTGRPIVLRRKIAKRYLRSWFPIDFVACVPFTSIAYWAGIDSDLRIVRMFKTLRLLRLLRVFRLNRILRRMEDSDLFALHMGIIRLVKFVGLILVAAHWSGCMFFMVSDNFNPESGWLQTLLDDRQLSYTDMSSYDWYIASIYWGVMTMTTIGYGDLTPVTSIERVYVMINMLFGAFLFAWVVGNMTSIVSNLDTRSRIYRQKMDALGVYMKYRRLPKHLRLRIRNHFSAKFQRQSFINDKELLNEMSAGLRNEVACCLNRDIISAVPLFAAASDDFLTRLAIVVKPVTYALGDVIISEGEVSNALFILNRGTVDAFVGDEAVMHHTDGSYFGESHLFFERVQGIILFVFQFLVN